MIAEEELGTEETWVCIHTPRNDQCSEPNRWLGRCPGQILKQSSNYGRSRDLCGYCGKVYREFQDAVKPSPARGQEGGGKQ